MSTRKGFNVYKNDCFVEFIDGRSHATCKRYIKDGKISIGTHMGQWRRSLTLKPERSKNKTCYEFEYSTTVGVYIRFQPAIM